MNAHAWMNALLALPDTKIGENEWKWAQMAENMCYPSWCLSPCRERLFSTIWQITKVDVRFIEGHAGVGISCAKPRYHSSDLSRNVGLTQKKFNPRWLCEGKEFPILVKLLHQIKQSSWFRLVKVGVMPETCVGWSRLVFSIWWLASNQISRRMGSALNFWSGVTGNGWLR